MGADWLAWRYDIRKRTEKLPVLGGQCLTFPHDSVYDEQVVISCHASIPAEHIGPTSFFCRRLVSNSLLVVLCRIRILAQTALDDLKTDGYSHLK